MNLNYTPKLKCTFEVLQQMLMELDGNMLSKKAQARAQSATSYMFHETKLEFSRDADTLLSDLPL
ncbi:hypothetical protein NQZ68_035378 [Dissostichus eleginoides]|nr:hypothetical protein NQZ68_035378 [Dissostichus eleginoides]